MAKWANIFHKLQVTLITEYFQWEQSHPQSTLYIVLKLATKMAVGGACSANETKYIFIAFLSYLSV